MDELEQPSESAMESGLESAFGGTPAPETVAPPTDHPQPHEAEGEAAEPQAESKEPAGPEPEFEFEYEGKVHKLVGRETIAGELMKARDYSQKTEQVARMRDAIVAHAQAAVNNQQFQGAIMEDFAQLRAIDASLARYQQIDWNAAIDTNFTEAMKLQEQRNQLKAMRDAKFNDIQAKQQQFVQGQAQAAQNLLGAESQALLAKLPAWRNGEKANAEQKALQGYLRGEGFNAAEIDGLTDHRAVIVARKAWLYDQLMANKSGLVKQAREAPGMVRPGAAPGRIDGRTLLAKNLAKVREMGSKGNHRSQESMVTAMLDRAFPTDKR